MTKILLPIALFMAMFTAALGIGQSAAAENSRSGPSWAQSAAQAAPAGDARIQLAHWDPRKWGHRHAHQTEKRKYHGWHKTHRKGHRYGWYDSHRKPPRYGWYGSHRKPPRYGAHKPRHHAHKPRHHGRHFFYQWGGHEWSGHQRGGHRHDGR